MLPLKTIKVEDSKTADYVHEVRNLLTWGKIENIEKKGLEIKEKSLEMLSIIEHMAESYSLVCLKDYLSHFPDKRYSQSTLDGQYDRIEQMVLSRGVFSQQFNEFSDNPKMLEQYGMRYIKHISDQGEEVNRNLVMLGYDPLNPDVAYQDMDELRARAKEGEFTMDDVLMPMNHAKAMIGLRYSTEIPLFMDVIEKHGKSSFDKLLNCECISDVQGLL